MNPDLLIFTLRASDEYKYSDLYWYKQHQGKCFRLRRRIQKEKITTEQVKNISEKWQHKIQRANKILNKKSKRKEDVKNKITSVLNQSDTWNLTLIKPVFIWLIFCLFFINVQIWPIINSIDLLFERIRRSVAAKLSLRTFVDVFIHLRTCPIHVRAPPLLRSASSHLHKGSSAHFPADVQKRAAHYLRTNEGSRRRTD